MLLDDKLEILANDFDLQEILYDNDIEVLTIVKFLHVKGLIDLSLYDFGDFD